MKKQEYKPKINFVRGNDWCHFCGQRCDLNVEVKHASNAEAVWLDGSKAPEEAKVSAVVRICSFCARQIHNCVS